MINARAYLVLVFALLPCMSRAQTAPFSEQLILSGDRAAVIATLLPGSSAAFFEQIRLAQHEGRLDDADALLEAWHATVKGTNSQRTTLENRQALLRYATSPDITYDHLLAALTPTLDHERSAAVETAALPTSIAPGALSLAALTDATLAADRSTLKRFTTDALPRLLDRVLTDAQRAELLERLTRPDAPRLVEHIVRDLQARDFSAFGDRGVHARLTLAQLEDLAQQRPAVLDERAFVESMLQRLAPGHDVALDTDDDERRAWLARLEAFTTRLSPRFNSLKAHVLYHRMLDDERRGSYDRERFVRYLRMPSLQYLRTEQQREAAPSERVDVGAVYSIGLRPIADDGQFVERMLHHFLAREQSGAGFSDFIAPAKLRVLQAEAQILAGADDPERWFAQLDEERRRALRDRIEIAFAPTQQRFFAPESDVTLVVDVKNVSSLTVAVYDIDVSALSGPLNEFLSVEGLVANSTSSLTIDAPATQRVRREIPVPALSKPGSYVVDVVGGGLSVRAIIEKGRLHHTTHDAEDGQHVRVYSHDGTHLRDASVSIERQRFDADERGVIVLPFSSAKRAVAMVLEHGRLATRVTHVFENETYELFAGAWVDREALAQPRATLVLSPALTLNGASIAVDLLDDVTLTLVATDLDGVQTTDVLSDITLNTEGEFAHTLAVPERLASLKVTLRASIETLLGETWNLASESATFKVGGLVGTETIGAPLLLQTPSGWAVELLGRNGEPLVDEQIALRLAHRDFVAELPFKLRTDERGRASLGPLPGITRVTASHGEAARAWPIDNALQSTYDATPTATLHALVGDTVRIPWHGAPLDRRDVSLIELRGDVPFADRFSHVAVVENLLTISGLSAGAYTLHVRPTDTITSLFVSAGTRRDGLIVGNTTMALDAQPPLLRIGQLEVVGDELVVRVDDATATTRLHVIANRYGHELDPLLAWEPMPAWPHNALERDVVESRFTSIRPLSDEERYVLARRALDGRPGNMLDRPSLIMNPLAIDELNVEANFDSTGLNDVIGIGGGGGGGFGKLGRRGSSGRRAGSPASMGPGVSSRSADLRFLGDAPMLRLDVSLDSDGRARIPLSELGSRHLVRAVAVDTSVAAARTVALPEQPLVRRDRRLATSLPGTGTVVHRQRFDVLEAGARIVIERDATPRYDLVDTLDDIYQLQRSLCPDEELVRFEFLMRWPSFSLEQKLDHLSRFACHELHVFLHEKDRAFFDEHVRPTIADKRRPNIVDLWLLDADLNAFTESWTFSTLSVIEKALLARARPDRAAATSRWIAEGAPSESTQRARDALFALSGLDEEAVEVVAERLVTEDVAPSRAARGQSGRKRAGPPKLWSRPADLAMLVEHGYWQHMVRHQIARPIAPNRFWSEFAAADASAPFVSAAVIDATTSLTECVFALAFTDLPFEAGDHAIEVDDTTTTVTLASRALVAREELVAEAGELAPSVIGIGMSIRHRGSDRGLVQDELVVGETYMVQAIASNPTTETLAVDVLMQIPAGAVPLGGTRATRTERLSLRPFGIATLTQVFYYPEAVPASLTPVRASIDGKPVAVASFDPLRVVPEATSVDTTTWEHIAQHAPLAGVLDALRSRDIGTLDMDLVAWRMADRAAFKAITNTLRERLTYDATLWAYSLLHRDERTAAEYIAQVPRFVESCGGALVSPLLTIDAEARWLRQHVEYAPLFAPRTHPRPGQPRFWIGQLSDSWQELLEQLAWKPAFDDVDHLELTWWLLLQDRVDEALEMFARVDTANVGMETQIAYLSAYLAMSSSDPDAARAIASGHLDHPLAHWRERFAEVVAHADEAQQLDTAAGGAPTDPLDAGRRAPSLHVDVVNGEIIIEHENVATCEVLFAPVDIELMFSTRPFGSALDDDPLVTRPHRVETLDVDGPVTRLAMPDAYTTRNAIIEVRAGGLVERTTSEAHSMHVRLAESQGEVKVTDAAARTPLPAVYVKVYAKLRGGVVRFHKDGYTDLRGRFDYASLTGNTDVVESFAVLVMSDEHGSARREVDAPLR